MDKHPLVSVIFVLYKKFDNVFKAIDSILCQTYNNIELIVTDDGSPNFPEQEISNYINEHKSQNLVNVQILANKINVGTVKHLNNAYSKANGILIKCVAGDDELYNNQVIEKIVKRYLDNPFNVLSTSSISFNEDGSFFRFYPHVETGKKMDRSLTDAENQYKSLSRWRYHNLASGSTMVYNADFFKRIGGFDETYRLWEDGPYMYKMTKAGYKIDTAFDIISIKYSQGGMSSGNNPLLNADISTLLKDTYKNNKIGGSFVQRRYDSFYYKMNVASTFYQRLIIRLKYLDIYISYKLYWFKENRRGKKDIEYYKGIKRYFV